jgi:N-acetylmuramoyl-L-alanine amidase
MRQFLAGLIWMLLAIAAPAQDLSGQDLSGQDLSGLARLLPKASVIEDRGADVILRFGLSQPVPWRVRVLDEPPRVVLDFREVDWAGLGDVPRETATIVELRAGVFRPGWSRLVVELRQPMVVSRAGMITSPDVAIEVTLAPASAADFAARAALPEPAEWALPDAAALPKPSLPGKGLMVVVLDPGHGGIDPGAERDDLTEADLMLTFARELKELLVRDGQFEVILTREDDVFVPLETRISIARAAGATLLMSLHADALAEGEASGATIYTLSDEASDVASQALAERHDRDDLLAGVDLTAQDDLVAGVLMDMARVETVPRTERLSEALEAAMRKADLTLHREARQRAGFSVLKSPDIPSVLVEIGFMSSAADLKRLTDPGWRARMAGALRDGIKAWATQDATLRALRAP